MTQRQLDKWIERIQLRAMKVDDNMKILWKLLDNFEQAIADEAIK